MVILPLRASGQSAAQAVQSRSRPVPFSLPSEALCGGAAAAMVLRYWGAGRRRRVLLPRAGQGGMRLPPDARRQERGYRGLAAADPRTFVRARRGRPQCLIGDRPGASIRRNRRLARPTVSAERRAQRISDAAAEVRASWRAPTTDAGRLPVRSVGVPGRVLVQSPSGSGFRWVRGARRRRRQPGQQNDLAERTTSRGAATNVPRRGPASRAAGAAAARWPEVRDLADVRSSSTLRRTCLRRSQTRGCRREPRRLTWNRAGEPRIDIVTVSGLRRTSLGTSSAARLEAANRTDPISPVRNAGGTSCRQPR